MAKKHKQKAPRVVPVHRTGEVTREGHHVVTTGSRETDALMSAEHRRLVKPLNPVPDTIVNKPRAPESEFRIDDAKGRAPGPRAGAIVNKGRPRDDVMFSARSRGVIVDEDGAPLEPRPERVPHRHRARAVQSEQPRVEQRERAEPPRDSVLTQQARGAMTGIAALADEPEGE